MFEEKFSPIFDRRFVRWLTDRPASLFGLGIPPAQYNALAGDDRMADVLRRRLEKLACDFPVNDNYFAWQAFGRGYGRGPEHPLPPYLKPENYEVLRERIGRLDVRQVNFVDHLAAQADASLDRYVLLDAQDWMDDAVLTRLWSEITRTARMGARVLFRTAAEPTLLPGRVPESHPVALALCRGGIAHVHRGRPLVDLWRRPPLRAALMTTVIADSQSHAALMDSVYRGQRHIYDLHAQVLPVRPRPR